MPRVIRIDKSKFINPSLPRDYVKRVFEAHKQAVTSPDKINFALYKYEILRSLEFLIFNDVNLSIMSKEELDSIFDDLSRAVTRSLFTNAIRYKEHSLKGVPVYKTIENFFYIYKYDRMCARESQDLCDDITVSEFIRKYDIDQINKKLHTYSYFNLVFNELSKDYSSSDFEKKLYSSIILNEGFDRGKFSSFSNKLINGLSPKYRIRFNEYFENIVKLVESSFEEFKADVIKGDFG